MQRLGNVLEVRHLRLANYWDDCFCLEIGLMPLSTSLMLAISSSMADKRVSVVSVGLEVVSIKENVRMEGNPPASIVLMYMVSDSASNKATVEPGERG